ncbi:hypothetical protein C0995_012715 [Termitomyces sp. Mi166|nr:hypothetical protein C0995_012715 [Termitomyces sp. Mi166\
MQKKCPPLEALIIAKHIKLVWAAKPFLEQQGKSLQFFVLEGFKGKAKAKALVVDSELTGTKQAFKLTELVDSDSNEEEEEEEERVHIIKKIKHEHIEEPISTRKGKKTIELEDLAEETVVPKTPMAGPLCQTLKPVVLVSSMPKPVPKPIVALASPVAGLSTACIVLSSAPKPAAALPISKPAPVKSAVRQFKLAGTEESGVLIINQVTEVAAGKDTSNKYDNNEDGNDDEGGKGDDDNSDNDNAVMDVDSANKTE